MPEKIKAVDRVLSKSYPYPDNRELKLAVLGYAEELKSIYESKIQSILKLC